jgi:hypothetical protein
MLQKFIDMKVSVVTIIGWVLAAIGLTFSVSSAYGEQKQKLLYLAERQTKIEITLDRLELLQRDTNLTIARIETEIKARSKK